MGKSLKVHHIFSVAVCASCTYGRCVSGSSSFKLQAWKQKPSFRLNSSGNSSAVILEDLEKEGISILF